MQPRDWAKKYNEYLFSHDLRSRIMSVDYASTDIEMPPLEKVDVVEKFSHNEASVYEAILTLATETLEDFLAKRVKWAALLALFCALRKSCVCSYLGITKGGSLSEKQLKEADHLQGINKWVVQRDQEAGLFCTKFNAVVNLVKNGEPDDIFLVFSAFAESLKLLIERLELEKITGDLFIGEMKYDARIECLNRFRRGETKVLCLTFKVGSEGLNLTEANKVIFLDLWWNEATLSQAQSHGLQNTFREKH
jgi:SNF2 family DNA or RNA helicase